MSEGELSESTGEERKATGCQGWLCIRVTPRESQREERASGLGASQREKTWVQLAILRLFAEECIRGHPSSGFHTHAVHHPTRIMNTCLLSGEGREYSEMQPTL